MHEIGHEITLHHDLEEDNVLDTNLGGVRLHVHVEVIGHVVVIVVEVFGI